MENEGEIYCIKSPSGKMYVGQCVKILSSGKKWGYISRWKDHIRDSKGKNFCRLLNNSIRKYGSENFSIEILKECSINELNYYETHYIELLNTMSPNGYNLTLGGSCGRNSQETINLKRINMIGKNVGKIYPKRIRKREQDSSLPKYLRHYEDNSGKEGYRISHHPFLKDKSFFGKTISLEEKLNSALNYLNTADIRLRFNE